MLVAFGHAALCNHSIRLALLMGQFPFHRSHLALGMMRWVFRDHLSPTTESGSEELAS